VVWLNAKTANKTTKPQNNKTTPHSHLLIFHIIQSSKRL